MEAGAISIKCEFEAPSLARHAEALDYRCMCNYKVVLRTVAELQLHIAAYCTVHALRWGVVLRMLIATWLAVHAVGSLTLRF